MSTQTTPSDDEYLIDLSKLWHTIKQSWKLIAVITTLSAILALALTFFIPKQWEASTTIHIGQVPLNSAKLELIEEPSQTVERLKLREFKEKVLANMGLPIDENVDDRSDIVIDTLKGTATKGTEFVNLMARGYSTGEAEEALKATVDELKVAHALITEPVKKRLTQELQETNNKLTGLSTELKTLNAQMVASGTYKAGSEFAPSIVAINLLATKEAEVRTLKAQEIQLNAQLEACNERATQIINKIQVAKRAAFPKRSIFLALGLFFGLVLGVGVALMRPARTKTTNSSI